MRFHFWYIAYFYTMCNTPAREYDLALVTHANTVSEVKPLQGNLRIPGIYMIYKDFYFFFFFLPAHHLCENLCKDRSLSRIHE